MSLFGDLDLENASDDPFYIPSDFYDMVITKVEVKNGKKDETKKYLVLEYTIVNSDDYDDETVQEWKNIPTEDDLNSADKETSKRARQNAAYLKKRLAQLGVPENKMNTVKPDDLLNIEVTAYLEKNGDYMNISNKDGHFRLRDELPGGTPINPESDGLNTFAGKDEAGY